MGDKWLSVVFLLNFNFDKGNENKKEIWGQPTFESGENETDKIGSYSVLMRTCVLPLA